MYFGRDDQTNPLLLRGKPRFETTDFITTSRMAMIANDVLPIGSWHYGGD